jgi:hypothetical protein
MPGATEPFPDLPRVHLRRKALDMCMYKTIILHAINNSHLKLISTKINNVNYHG